MTTATAKTGTRECHRCDGSGHIRAFAHIASGVCFTCRGTGRAGARRRAADRFAPIDAMRCETLAEAQSFRMAELVAASRTWRRKLGDIERRLAAACSVRWDVRAAMPTRLDYDRETRTFTWDCRFYFFVDGVRINFEEWNQNYCTPVLYGENWRAFDIGANKT